MTFGDQQVTNDRQKRRAYGMICRAIEKGDLVRPNRCELCNRERIPYPGIVGHHYNGYDDQNALNLWWVCRSCNSKLEGIHDGSMTKEEARCFITT